MVSLGLNELTQCAWTKWLTFHIQCFWMHSLDKNTDIIVFKFHLVFRPNDKKSLSHHVMAWCQTGTKPLPEPMMTYLTDIYYASPAISELISETEYAIYVFNHGVASHYWNYMYFYSTLQDHLQASLYNPCAGYNHFIQINFISNIWNSYKLLWIWSCCVKLSNIYHIFEQVNILKKHLKSPQSEKTRLNLMGDGLARAFLRALVALIGELHQDVYLFVFFSQNMLNTTLWLV